MSLTVDQARKRQLGIYYTPPALTQSICSWAVRQHGDRILEPSFGGCVFLDYASQTLRARGSNDPFDQLFGCDIDIAAFDHLRRLFPNRRYERQFLRHDFLALDPLNAPFKSVDVVIGNPPYVSNHNMRANQRKSAQKCASLGMLRIPATASLWAHFVSHSVRFLRDGGRLGMVLPGNAFQVDYGRSLLRQLSERFGEVHIISLSERVFAEEGTGAATTLLLCNNWMAQSRSITSVTGIQVRSLADLRKLLPTIREGSGESGIVVEADPITNKLRESIASAFKRDMLVSLSDMAEIQIGIVTGANRFFMLSEMERVKYKVPNEAARPLLSRINMAPGSVLTQADLEAGHQRGDRCLFLDTRGFERRASIRRYLASFPETKRKKNRTFRKRAVWHQPTLGLVPDGFLTYMNTRGPRLVINAARVQSLNNIHRLYLKQGIEIESLQLASVSLLSTMGQLAAELLGRSYGDGVLKIEPSEARQLPILSSRLVNKRRIASTSQKIDILLRLGQFDEARRAADSLIVESLREVYTKDSNIEARHWLRALRSHRGIENT